MSGGAVHLHRDDLPSGLGFGPLVAVDTETMGLDHRRDRLCLVQLFRGGRHRASSADRAAGAGR